MSYSILAIDRFFHYTVLVNADGGENVEHSFVHSLEAVNDESHRNPLPSRSSLFRGSPPVLGLFGLANVTNIQHDAIQGSSVQSFVLVGRRHGD